MSQDGRGFKRILGIWIAPKSDRGHAPPDGISTGRQIEHATVEEKYAARVTFVQKAPAVRISRGVFPVQRLNACVNALTS